MKKAGCEFRTIMAAIGIAQGGFEQSDPAIIVRRDADRRKNAEKHALQARKLWNQAGEVSGSVAEIYLARRNHLRPTRYTAVSPGMLAHTNLPALACHACPDRWLPVIFGSPHVALP